MKRDFNYRGANPGPPGLIIMPGGGPGGPRGGIPGTIGGGPRIPACI